MRIVVILAALAVSAFAPRASAGASPWAEDTQSAVRLIAGEGLVAGLEIRPADGFKTY